MLFRVESEIPPTVQIRLKVEINCFEHFNVLGLTKIPFKVENSWFTGEAELTTYHFEELLGTKLRALYQRKKGRDLFDLYIALQRKDVDVDKVLQCYKKYMEFVVDKAPSYKQFVNNMQEKMEDAEFTNDMQSLLRPGIIFNASDAYSLICETFIDKMEGKRAQYYIEKFFILFVLYNKKVSIITKLLIMEIESLLAEISEIYRLTSESILTYFP